MKYQNRDLLIHDIVVELLEEDLLNTVDYTKFEAIRQTQQIIEHKLEDYKLVQGDMI